MASLNNQAIESLAAKVLDLVDRGNLTPIILIDGRAGSGKSTLAEKLQQLLFRDGESLPRVIHMDDLYPGWEGLAAGSEYLNRFILTPLQKGETASWQNWNWEKGERDQWREFSAGTPLIIEGCGAISVRSSEQANLRIWLEADEETRRQRWIEREGNDAMFETWAASELDFYAREKSKDKADLVFSTD
jgi:uridine kinase